MFYIGECKKSLFIYFTICFQFCFLNHANWFWNSFLVNIIFLLSMFLGCTSAFISLSICQLALQPPGDHWKELRLVIFLIRFALILTDQNYYQSEEKKQKKTLGNPVIVAKTNSLIPIYKLSYISLRFAFLLQPISKMKNTTFHGKFNKLT